MVSSMMMSRISIHAPQWGATARRSPARSTCSNFNPRTPVGCDTLPKSLAVNGTLFQSTHPSGVRRPFRRTWFGSWNFNPRTPVGCDPSRPRPRPIFRVISIHAPQWGATTARPWTTSTRTNFNPRTPVGCDSSSTFGSGGYMSYFNPRTPVGCDRRGRHGDRRFFEFQSTHPSGVRPTPLSAPSHPANFNPRTPVGCDAWLIPNKLYDILFQSTHPSGVRPTSSPASPSPHGISIHAPQWGATTWHGTLAAYSCISIHAPQWGATW